MTFLVRNLSYYAVLILIFIIFSFQATAQTALDLLNQGQKEELFPESTLSKKTLQNLIEKAKKTNNQKAVTILTGIAKVRNISQISIEEKAAIFEEMSSLPFAEVSTLLARWLGYLNFQMHLKDDWFVKINMIQRIVQVLGERQDSIALQTLLEFLLITKPDEAMLETLQAIENFCRNDHAKCVEVEPVLSRLIQQFDNDLDTKLKYSEQYVNLIEAYKKFAPQSAKHYLDKVFKKFILTAVLYWFSTVIVGFIVIINRIYRKKIVTFPINFFIIGIGAIAVVLPMLFGERFAWNESYNIFSVFQYHRFLLFQLPVLLLYFCGQYLFISGTIRVAKISYQRIKDTQAGEWIRVLGNVLLFILIIAIVVIMRAWAKGFFR